MDYTCVRLQNLNFVYYIVNALFFVWLAKAGVPLNPRLFKHRSSVSGGVKHAAVYKSRSETT